MTMQLKSRSIHAAGLLAALLFVSPTALGVQKSAHHSTQGIKGTAQLAGDVGEVGKTYTLVPKGDSPFNLRIDRLSYVASRIMLDGKMRYVDGDQKMLIVDYTIQNPNPKNEVLARRDTFDLMIVDPTNQNHKKEDDTEDLTNHKNLDIELKPGQKVQARAFVIVPAGGEMPKMMLSYDAKNGKVMRFDLHKKVEPVEEVIRDPSDASGATAMATVSAAKMGVNYPTGLFNINVEKAEFTTDPLYGNEPEDKSQFLVLTLLVQNQNPEDEDFNYGSVSNSLTSFVVTQDGDKIDRLHDALLDYRDDSKEAKKTVLANGEKGFRLVFQIPDNTPLKSLTLLEGKFSRTLVYDLSGVK